MAATGSAAMAARLDAVRRNFTTSQLVVSGLLFVVGVVGLMFFVQWAGSPTYQVLYSGVTAKDAADITTKLQGDGVAYQLQNGGTTILVPSASLNQERVAVAAAGLPKNGSSGWDVFDKQGVTSSSFQQQVAYQRAVEGQLASTLEQMNGVSNASVSIVMPQTDLFVDTNQPARASVMLDTTGTPSDDLVQSAIHLVASSVPNLDPKDVTVTDTAGDLLSDAAGTTGDRAVRQAQAYDDALAAQATSMLDQLLGPGHAVVRVNATMNTQTQTVDSETYAPKGSVVLNQQSAKETYTGAAASTASGVVSSNPTNGTTGSAGGPGAYNKSSTTQQYGTSRTVSHTESSPGGVQRLTVSVAVDSNAKNAPPAAQLQQLVSNAVGLDPKRGDTISVTQSAFPIATSAATTATAPKVSPLTSLAHGKTGSLVGSGLAGLVLLLVAFGFVRAAKSSSVEDIPLDQVAALQAGLAPTALGSGGKGGKGGKGRQLPAATGDASGLHEMEPDALAGVLRGWLASTGGEQ